MRTVERTSQPAAARASAGRRSGPKQAPFRLQSPVCAIITLF
jgi:hypothetical protein